VPGHHHPHVHVGPDAAATGRRLRLALGLTALFVVLEGTAGFLSHSLALVSDAGHNLADAMALLLTLWTFGLVTAPATARRTFGLHRAGILAALVNASALIVIAVGIFVEAYFRLRAPVDVAAGPMIAIAAVALVLNFAIAMWLHAASKDDLNVRASFVHIAGDAASAAGVVVVGILIAVTGQSWLDPVVSVVIGVFILWTSRDIMIEAINVLLEATPSDLDAQTVQRAMLAVPGVLDVHDMHLWSVSSTLRAASAHVLVGDQPVSQACAILTAVNGVLADHYNIGHTSLQLETTSCDPDSVFCHFGMQHVHADGSTTAEAQRTG
jgi:cobalt-zinc-cadmium efflux system protein